MLIVSTFAGKVALVTGGTRGLGLAAAHAFVRRGARVVITARSHDQGQQAAEELRRAGGDVRFIPGDLADPATPEALVRETVTTFGRLDFAYNNAGVDGRFAPLADLDIAVFEHVINLNLRAVFLCMKYEIQQMLMHGGGVIVNCSSIASTMAFSGLGLYAAAKAGVNALTRNAAVEYSAQGIRTVAISPGAIKTELQQQAHAQMAPEVLAKIIAVHPIGRFGEPHEIGNVVAWLCSEEAGFITGACINIDGGAGAT
jgi:NAD(P)-dependent dehydrogenase (short-subunit alcohol dehydrogenase family)